MNNQVKVLGALTKDMLAVNFTELDHNSNTKVIVRCEHCGETFLRARRSLDQAHNCHPATDCRYCDAPKHDEEACFQKLLAKTPRPAVLAQALFEKLLRNQKFRCFYTGTTLYTSKHNFFRATEDISPIAIKLDESIGYIDGNVVLVTPRFQSYARLSSRPRLEAKILRPEGRLPTNSRTTDAGHDIYSCDDIEIPAHGVRNISTGIAVSAPPGYYYTVDGRSSLWSRGITPMRGTIDGTYIDELRVALVNTSNGPYLVHAGDKIAQITLHKIIEFDLVEVASFSPEYSERGTKGFGSSGR